LVAYVASEQALAAGRLRAHLKERLPEYMLPGAFICLPQFPLTPNGKIDRRNLPAPEQGRLDLGNEYVAPRTETQEALCRIWAEVLRVERVGITDNFFDLGGHSLKATQMISRVRDIFRVDLPLHCAFESPTATSFAEIIDRFKQSSRAQQSIRAVETPRQERLPLSFAQQRLWFLDRLEPNTAAYNIRRVIRMEGRLNTAALEKSIDEIIRRHETLRTTFTVAEGYPQQVVTPPSSINLPVTDLSRLPDDEREAYAQRLASEEVNRPFDLSLGPLFRTGLLRLSEHVHLLLLSMHHIISDGWSLGVFFREFSSLYNAYSAGEKPSLGDLSIQYADFA